jgi:hypothetical protein
MVVHTTNQTNSLAENNPLMRLVTSSIGDILECDDTPCLLGEVAFTRDELGEVISDNIALLDFDGRKALAGAIFDICAKAIWPANETPQS